MCRSLKIRQSRPEKYQVFFGRSARSNYSSIDLATDERRHDTVTHLANAQSVYDLHKHVSQQYPEGTPPPSEKWLLFQFWPKEVVCRTEYQCTGMLEVKFMIQSRQFHHHHSFVQVNIPINFVLCISGCDLFVLSVFNWYLREFVLRS